MKTYWLFKSSVICIAIFVSGVVSAQPRSAVKSVEELAKQKAVLVEDYPGIFRTEEIHNIEQIDPLHSKVFYSRDNVNFEAIVNSNRKDLLLVATCEQIPDAKIPAIVKDGFKLSEYGKYPIQKAFKVTTPYSANLYRIDVINDAKQLKSVFLNDKGEYHEPLY